MSSTHMVQDATGIVVNEPGVGVTIAQGRTAMKPAAGAVGYAPGCLFIDTQAGTYFRNSGTAASANFVAFP